MNTRRTFLKTAAAAAVSGKPVEWSVALASDRRPVVVRDARVIRVRDRNGGATELYLKITSESGLSGFAGPLLAEQAAAFPADLHALLVGRDVAESETVNFNALWTQCHPGRSLERYADGKDPLSGATVWSTVRARRHTETGWLITALSAIDLALWDLRGKAAGQPVWRLLGASRQRLSAYASMLGYSVKPTEAAKTAREFFDKGFKKQKWFFMSGPVDGAEGLKQNIELVRACAKSSGRKRR